MTCFAMDTKIISYILRNNQTVIERFRLSPISFFLNCRKFCDSCSLLLFKIFVNALVIIAFCPLAHQRGYDVSAGASEHTIRQSIL